MKKRFFLIFTILFLALEFAFTQNQKSVDIMFMHDIHSFLDRMSKAKTLIDEQCKKNPNTFVFDGGDFSMGTLYQTVFETQASELRLLGKLGIDASTLGNHEFDYGAEALKNMLDVAFLNEAVLPKMVLCNIDYSSQNEYTKIIFPTLKKYFNDYVIIQKGNIKIAVIGVFGLDAFFCSPTCKIKFLDPIQAVKSTVTKIKQNENVDMIVCLSHGGTNPNPKKSEDELLAKKVPEIDLIVSGHTHTLLEKPKKVGNTIIASCGSNCVALGNMSFEQTKNNRWNLTKYNLLPIDDSVQDNKEISDVLQNYSSSIDQEYLAQFGFTKNQILTEASYDLELIDEVGYAMADAMLKSVNKLECNNQEPTVDFSVIPSGTLRDTYKKGTVTVNDIFTSYSLGIGPDKISGYPLVSFYLTGKELKSVAELDCSLSPMMEYVRLYANSFAYDYNPHRFILDKVTDVYSIDKNGVKQNIQSQKSYRIVCDLYTANMLGEILSKTKGIISIVPKDKDGNVITNFENHIVYIKNSSGNKVELKGWYAIAYSFAKNKNLGDWSNARANAACAKSSLNPIYFFRNPSKVAIVLYTTILVLIAIIIILVCYIAKKIKQRK